MSGYRAENIGRIIAEKRKEAGMTQEQLAQKLMITPQAVSKWENGVGLPDVTLIPQIAGALGISMDELFGVSGQARGNVPQTLFGLQLVCVEGDTAVYSNKSIETEQDGTVTFSDGSTADTKTNTVTNCGPGEARILSLHDIAPEALSSDGYERGTLVKTFCDTRSLSVYNGAMCEIEITRGNDGETVVEAEGSKLFLSRLELSVSGDTLTVNAQSGSNNNYAQNSRILIKVGYDRGNKLDARISGCGCIHAKTISYTDAACGISGSGSINVKDLDTCNVRISGSGDVATEDVRERLEVAISGSGDVACAHVRNVSVRIAGSGDLAVMNLDGSLEATIAGSGDICCSGGEVETLRVNINGSGSLACERLVVGDAEITVRGSGTIALGRIKGKSVERLSKNSELKVGQRG